MRALRAACWFVMLSLVAACDQGTESDSVEYGPVVVEPMQDSSYAELADSAERYEGWDSQQEYVDSTYQDEYGYDDEYEDEEPRVAAFEQNPPSKRDAVSVAQWDSLTSGYEYEREPAPKYRTFKPNTGFDFGTGWLEGVRTFAWILVVALLIAALLYFASRYRKQSTEVASDADYGLTDELLAASASELESALDKNLEQQDYRAAIRYRFGQLLQLLRREGLLRWVPGKTNAEYTAELPEDSAGGVRSAFAKLASAFAYATYAGREVTQAQYGSFSESVDTLQAQLNARRTTRSGSPGAGLVSIMLVACLGLTSCSEWYETYDPHEDDAYGTEVLPGALQVAFPNATYQVLASDWAEGDSLVAAEHLYVAVGEGLSYSEEEAAALLKFVEGGGEALLATKGVSRAVLLPFADSAELYYRRTFDLRYVANDTWLRSARGEQLRLPVITERVGDGMYVYYIDRYKDYLAESSDLLVMTDEQTGLQLDEFEMDTIVATPDFVFTDSTEVLPILVRLPYGKGALTLLSVPMLLTNVYAADSAGSILLEEVLSYLPAEPRRVSFDEPRRSSIDAIARENQPPRDPFGRGPRNADGNIIKHVLSRPPLAIAWYALLLGGLVLLVISAKRRQRMIPLVQPRRNTTHEHLGNISRLYLARPDNALMARKQLKLFEAYCKRRFNLVPLRNPEDYERFRNLQGINTELLDALARYQNTIDRSQGISNAGLVRLVRIIQQLKLSVR